MSFVLRLINFLADSKKKLKKEFAFHRWTIVIIKLINVWKGWKAFCLLYSKRHILLRYSRGLWTVNKWVQIEQMYYCWWEVNTCAVPTVEMRSALTEYLSKFVKLEKKPSYISLYRITTLNCSWLIPTWNFLWIDINFEVVFCTGSSITIIFFNWG